MFSDRQLLVVEEALQVFALLHPYLDSSYSFRKWSVPPTAKEVYEALSAARLAREQKGIKTP